MAAPAGFKLGGANVCASKGSSPIIVAESDFLTGVVVVAAIEAVGRRAVIARDGETLLGLIEKHAPELLILSMNLARPGGAQMLRFLQQKKLQVKIVATTRVGQANLRATARTLGVTSFLELPFLPEDLHQQIDRILGGRS